MVKPIGSDADNIASELQLTLQIRKPEDNLSLVSLSVIFDLSYELSNIVKMKMNGLAVASIDTLVSKSNKLNPQSVFFDGTLNLI